MRGVRIIKALAFLIPSPQPSPEGRGSKWNSGGYYICVTSPSENLEGKRPFHQRHDSVAPLCLKKVENDRHEFTNHIRIHTQVTER